MNLNDGKEPITIWKWGKKWIPAQPFYNVPTKNHVKSLCYTLIMCSTNFAKRALCLNNKQRTSTYCHRWFWHALLISKQFLADISAVELAQMLINLKPFIRGKGRGSGIRQPWFFPQNMKCCSFCRRHFCYRVSSSSTLDSFSLHKTPSKNNLPSP